MTQVQELFVKEFFSVEQLQRFLIYFSSKHAQIGKQDTLTEVVVNLLSAPLTVTLGQHGVFSSRHISCCTRMLRWTSSS